MKDVEINKCDSCDKSFTRSGHLKRHIKTLHEGKTNVRCDSCEEYFTESGSLKKHIKTIHEGQRNYKCDSCGKYFTISRQYMKDKKITNVILVGNHSLNQEA